MCGIIGYIGNKNTVPLLIEGLKKLEYRGYDSAGICVKGDDCLQVVKRKGRISELEKYTGFKEIIGNVGIAHTRWATHGEPSEINAHPHLDCKKEIAVVHNGIIENYYSLKKILEKEGHKFLSETDTEVVAHLIEKFYTGNLEEAVSKSLKLIEGTFGLVIIHKNEDKIVAAKRGSPMIIGIGKNEKIIASDSVAILSHTKKIVYLNDDEIAVIKRNSLSIKNLDGKTIDKKICEIKWTIDQIEKRGFKHFTLKEIFEQPEAIKNTLRGRVKNGKIKLSVNLDINCFKRIIIAACGTSWHSALIGKDLIEKLVGIPVEVYYASEFRYRNPIIGKDDLLIAVSQSGETADTIGAIKEAKLKGAKTLGIVNVVGSTITREVDSGIYLHAGHEIGVAATKAFTCQVISFLLLALFWQQQKGMKLDKTIIKELEILPGKIEKILKKSEEIKKLAKRFIDSKDFFYLGRGISFPVALEGALKLKETSYIHAEGYPAGEMKHGPIALIEENTPVVFVCPQSQTYQKTISNMQEIKARGGSIIAIINKEDEKIKKLTKNIIKVPECCDELTPILNSIPLQLFAYHVANLKGIDVDKPKNLAKSVTVE